MLPPRALSLSLILASCASKPPAVSAPAGDVTRVTDAPVSDVTATSSACGATSSASLMGCVRVEHLRRDVTVVAAPRAPSSEHHGAVRELCATRLASLGYVVERHDYGTGVNILGLRAGADPTAPRVMISAHYDHIPGCAGADDNASGVAGALEAARVLATGRFARTLVIACWDEEERGLVGSSAYVRRARSAGERVAVSYVLEMIGYRSREANSQRLPQGFSLLFPRQTAELMERENRGDFITLVADEGARDAAAGMVRAAEQVALPTVSISLTPAQVSSPLFSVLQRSDHAPFWRAGQPAVQITDTAEFRNPHYHCADGPDTVESLDFEFMSLVVKATVGAAVSSLELRAP